MRRTIGIDIGGTKMLAVAIDPEAPADILETARLPTPKGTEAVLAAVADLVERVDSGGDASVGIGIPGLVDASDHFLSGPNLPGVVGLDIGGRLRGLLDRSVAADNDATCAAFAEFSAGAGVGYDDGLLLTIGTGIGGGIYVDGEMRRGANGFAGEPGHMMIDPSGPRCPCGRRGCWERFASGSGLGRLGRDAAIAGRLDAAVELAGDVEGVRGEHVVAVARSGDEQAGEVLDDFAWWMAAGIANLANLLDPAVIILGGGVMESADVLLDRVRASLPDQVLESGLRPKIDVITAALGESAGAIGAALLAAQA